MSLNTGSWLGRYEILALLGRAGRAIEARYPLIVAVLGPLRSSPKWPALAGMMNLPQQPLRSQRALDVN
jgi:hypothetical protein